MYKNFVIALTMFFFGFWYRNVPRCIRRQLSLARRTVSVACTVAPRGGATGPVVRLRGRCGFSGTAYYEDMMYTGAAP